MIDYHRLVDIAPWAYGIGLLLLVAVKLVGTGGGREALDQSRRRGPLSAFGVGKVGADSGDGAVFWGIAGRRLSWADIAKAFALIACPCTLC